MLENYKRESSGIIHQINITKTVSYTNEYVENSYEKYGEKPNYISYLRYGYLIGVIGRKPESILDFGYGNGAFLNVIKEDGVNSFGYDITEYDVPLGCEKITHEEIFKKHFDVVTFFDSLEHVDDIYFLNKIDCNYIMISVPECHYFSDEWFKNWKHLRPNEHLWHFSKVTIVNFFREQGYEFIDISNIEDVIRKPVDENTNILTGIFRKL